MRALMLPRDPVMLLSVVNMKLRDEAKDLDTLCERLDINRQEVEETLSKIDYHYDEEHNQFV